MIAPEAGHRFEPFVLFNADNLWGSIRNSLLYFFLEAKNDLAFHLGLVWTPNGTPLTISKVLPDEFYCLL